MSYQVTLNSRNVLVPLSLEDRSGERMHAPLSRLDTATAMLVGVSSTGSFHQEFIPLRIRRENMRGYAGEEWELWVQKAGSDLYCYYLGVPDRCFATDAEGRSPRSLSIQVVGSSPLTGREEFTGGADVTLLAQVSPPLIPGFMNLGERFFPSLLPHNFIERHAIDVFEFGGRRQPILMAALQSDPADRIPVSLEKHWDARNWIQAVVENLSPRAESGEPAYYTVRGGCFYDRNRKVTHWFGGEIGLDAPGFREAAAEKIRSLGQSGNGAWIFWLEPRDAAGMEIPFRRPADDERRRIAIRHPMMHRLLSHRGPTRTGSEAVLADLPAAEAVAALGRVARVLLRHQEILQRALAEPSHAEWSDGDNVAASTALALEGLPSAPIQAASGSQAALEADVRELYREYGETLRSLESIFDETYGYSAWDAVGNPMRETLSAYLVDKPTDARTAA